DDKLQLVVGKQPELSGLKSELLGTGGKRLRTGSKRLGVGIDQPRTGVELLSFEVELLSIESERRRLHRSCPNRRSRQRRNRRSLQSERSIFDLTLTAVAPGIVLDRAIRFACGTGTVVLTPGRDSALQKNRLGRCALAFIRRRHKSGAEPKRRQDRKQ